MEDVIEKGTGKTVNTESVVINFRQKLYEAIELKFNRNWDELELDASVSNLNYSKAVTQDEEKKWRPMGQSVDDQLLPAMTNALNRKRTMLQRQVDYQNRLITEIVPRLEQTRQDLRGRSEQRRQILAQIEKDTEVLKVADGKIDEINKMLRRWSFDDLILLLNEFWVSWSFF